MSKILIGIVNFGSFLSVIAFLFLFSFYPRLSALSALLPVLLSLSRISKVNSSDVKILDSVGQTFRRSQANIFIKKKKKDKNM